MDEPPKILAGKVAIVTGAGRGVGREEALALAAHGARVVVNARSDSADAVAAEILGRGGEALAYKASVANPAEAAGLVEAAIARFGGLDILVNNAGVSLPKLLDEVRPVEFQELFDINVVGHLNMMQLAAKVMRPRRAGRIINTASAAFRGPTGNIAYGASKAAVAALTWGAAWELRNDGVTCNAISPFGMTEQVERGIAAFGRLVDIGLAPPEVADALKAYPGPEYAAPLVVYLASDAAAHVTGQIFRSGGGRISIYSHPSETNLISKDIAVGDNWTFEELARRMPEEVLAGISPWWSAPKLTDRA